MFHCIVFIEGISRIAPFNFLNFASLLKGARPSLPIYIIIMRIRRLGFFNTVF